MIPIKPVNNAATTAASVARFPSGQMEGQSGGAAQAALVYLKPGKLHLQALPPLSLYIHIPWCVKKCPYCDFNSHEIKASAGADITQTDIPEAAYLDALRADLEQSLPLIWGRKIMTVFIGGGTPSLLSAAGLDRLLADIRMLLPLDGAAEITMEANPGTFEAERFRSYAASGINRLSLGIQSFSDRHLAALGRIHSGHQARAAIDTATQAFERVNLDLMYALPEQTLSEASADIDTAIGFGTTHLSLYHLTLEPNTLFAKYPPVVPDDDLSADMQDMISERTSQAGFQRYEVSAYARPASQPAQAAYDQRSRHNLNYWQFGDYLGIGAGAHSKLSFPHRIIRQMRYRQPKAYMAHALQQQFIQEEHEIDSSALGFEFMLNAMRLTGGITPNLFTERCGLTLNQIETELQQAEQRGLLLRTHDKLAPTELGMRFLNDLQEIFLRTDAG